MAEILTLYKLMVMYMLMKIDSPLTTAQISEFILEKGYTTYFKLQEALSEMVEANMLNTETTHNRTLYQLTSNGAETIQILQTNLSQEIRIDIRNFLREKQYSLKEEVGTKSTYYRLTNQQYEAHCQILEDGYPLIDLKLSVPTEAEAKSIVTNWPERSQEIYASLLAQLL